MAYKFFFILIFLSRNIYAAETENTFFFAFTKTDPVSRTPHTSYIYGTDHGVDFDAISGFTQSELFSKEFLVVENQKRSSDFTMEQCQEWGFCINDGDESPLSHLSVEHKDRLIQYVSRRVPDLDFSRLTPTFLGEMYAQGYFINSVNNRILHHYQKTNKDIIGVDDDENIRDFFEVLTIPQLQNLLHYPVHEHIHMCDTKTYLMGVPPLTRLDNTDMIDIQRRNALWVEKLRNIHATRPGYVACFGLDYVVGPYNLLRSLWEDGYNIQHMNAQGEWSDFHPMTFSDRYIIM